MGVALKQIMDRFAAMEKIAHEKIAEDPTGTENSAELKDVPGAEHDVKVPAEAKKPDEEVAEGQPAGAASTEGAVNGGDAKPLNEGKLEFDQPVLNPDEKPVTTDDALTAKTASQKVSELMNDLLSDLMSDKAEKKAAVQEAKAVTEKKSAVQEEKDVTEKKAAVQEAKAVTEEKADKAKDQTKAASNKIEIDGDMISKLAAAVSAYNKGKETAEKIAAAKQDAEDEQRGIADAIKHFGSEKVAAAIDKADEERGMADCIMAIKQACVKIAQEAGLPPEAAEAVADQAVQQGLAGEDVAEAAAPEAGGDAPAEDVVSQLPDDVTEEELGQAIVDLVQSGEIPPEAAKELVGALAGGDDTAAPSEDDVANIIADGIASGEITPEDAEAIVSELTGGDGSAAEAAPAAAEADVDAMNAAQGAADAEEAVKAASAEINKDPKARILNKVACAVNDKLRAQAKYTEGFKKRAEELGADPVKLAQYVLAKKAEAEKAKAEKAKQNTK